MNIGMMQPSFLPWQGYFELIARSDRFIFLDDFQFSVQSYHQRNRLFINKGQVGWITVPVKKASFKKAINEAQINDSLPWRIKTWKCIQQNYSKAPFYRYIATELEQWLFTEAISLGELNLMFIKMVCEIMGMSTEFWMSHELPSNKVRSDRVLELLRWVEADTYYCSHGSFDYMAEDGVFPLEEGINVLFQSFVPKPYLQVGSPKKFVPYLSVLDALMNIGPDETRSLIHNGTKQWLSWDEITMLRASQNG